MYVLPKHVEGEAEVVVVAHIDDILVSTPRQTAMELFIADITIQDLVMVSYSTSCHIERSRIERMLELNQHIYATTVAERSQVVKARMVPAVADSVPLSKVIGPQTGEEIKEMRGTSSREALAALM